MVKLAIVVVILVSFFVSTGHCATQRYIENFDDQAVGNLSSGGAAATVGVYNSPTSEAALNTDYEYVSGRGGSGCRNHPPEG